MIAILDYGGGNLTSVSNVLAYLGFEHFVSEDPERCLEADRLIFPGVGAAHAAMQQLQQRGLDQAILEFAQSGKPMMGICVGCQVLLDHSEEDGGVKTLSLVPGLVKRFQSEVGLKIPHMGWNQVNYCRSHVLFNGINDGSDFYYVHSYFPTLESELDALATTQYGSQTFVGAYQRANVFATQFHAEKSGEVGLRLMANFCHWDGRDSLC